MYFTSKPSLFHRHLHITCCTEPCNCILFHLTSIDKPPRQSYKAAHRFLGCAVTHLSSWLAAPFQRSLKSALHLSTERCVPFPHLQAHLEMTHSHSASLFLWQGQTSTVWLWYSIFFSFFKACLKELVIVKRKNYYLNLVLMAGAGMQKHRAVASVMFFCTKVHFTVQQVAENLIQN